MPEIIPNYHPIFVHFTVALLSVSTVLFITALLLKQILPESLRNQLLIVARWNLWLGASITLVTVAAGFQAYNSVAHDGPSHAAMTDHRNWALATAGLFGVVAIWSVFRARSGSAPGRLFVVLLLAAQLVLLSTAWRGGELVYRYGLGVMSLPQSQGDGHDHSHGPGEGHGDHGADSQEEPMNFDGLEESMQHDGHDHEH